MLAIILYSILQNNKSTRLFNFPHSICHYIKRDYYGQRNIEQLEESTDRLKNITNKNPNHFKTKRLGSSIGNYATQLESDVLGKRRRNLIFPQGTLVYVNFGINYGSEYSSYHYAITLNKNESDLNKLEKRKKMENHLLKIYVN